MDVYRGEEETRLFAVRLLKHRVGGKLVMKFRNLLAVLGGVVWKGQAVWGPVPYGVTEVFLPPPFEGRTTFPITIP